MPAGNAAPVDPRQHDTTTAAGAADADDAPEPRRGGRGRGGRGRGGRSKKIHEPLDGEQEAVDSATTGTLASESHSADAADALPAAKPGRGMGAGNGKGRRKQQAAEADASNERIKAAMGEIEGQTSSMLHSPV